MGGANCVETLARVEAGCYLDLSLSADTARASDSPRLWSSPNDGYLVIIKNSLGIFKVINQKNKFDYTLFFSF